MEEREIVTKKVKTGNTQIQIRRNPNPNLPEDLLFFEILPRLPLKSLIKFKSVSRQWRSIISSPKFIKLHVHRSISNHHNHGVLLYRKSNVIVKVRNLESSFIKCISLRSKLHGDIDKALTLLSSCNGLLCLEFANTMRIWNPTTDESLKINRPVLIEKFCNLSLWGFGYVNSLDDYKIVRVVRGDHVNDNVVRQYVYSLSNRNRKWREIDSNSNRILFDKLSGIDNNGVVLDNGICHWVVHDKYAKLPSILAFDMALETFHEVVLPKDVIDRASKDLGPRIIIGSVKEDLCIGYQGVGQCLELWMLECYGKSRSWRKVLDLIGVVAPVMAFMSCCAWCRVGKGGQFLVLFDNYVRFVDCSKGTPRYIPLVETFSLCLKPFVETLVSPFMMDKAGQ